MRYSSILLAKAFLAASKDAPKEKHEDFLKNFMGLLHKHGNKIFAKKTFEEIGRLRRREQGIKTVEFVSARPISKKSLVSLTALFPKSDVLLKKVEPELIAGVKIVINNEFSLDNSMKRKLEKLFN